MLDRSVDDSAAIGGQRHANSRHHVPASPRRQKSFFLIGVLFSELAKQKSMKGGSLH